MELFRSFLRNTRKPEGFLGKCMVASMNYAHAALADWGLGCLPTKLCEATSMKRYELTKE